MSESIETEVKLLVRQLSDRATQGGGMDRLTYEALFAAAAALSGMLAASDSQAREEALHAIRVRLCACGSGPYAEVA